MVIEKSLNKERVGGGLLFGRDFEHDATGFVKQVIACKLLDKRKRWKHIDDKKFAVINFGVSHDKRFPTSARHSNTAFVFS